MYCSNCGKLLTSDCLFCNNCGHKVSIEEKPKITKKKSIIFGLLIGIILFSGVFYFSYFRVHHQIKLNMYITSSNIAESSHNNFQTIIETNNTYSNQNINNINDAYELIRKDSLEQKDSCPSEILKIEEAMINDFDITAVNLCEIDKKLAQELYNAMQKVYELFPSVKGNITNLTIGNMDSSMRSVIAFYQPLFPFAEGNSNTVYKMRVVLNSKYFLNNSLLEESTKNSSLSGHFPPNSTTSSPVAHELGHYISFYAMRKYNNINQSLLFNNDNSQDVYVLMDGFSDGKFSKKILEEAYNLYLSEGNKKMDFDEWRGKISKYALAKDESGKYIYDETIAEAFHDVYLNDDKAKIQSTYILRVLRMYVEA